MKWLDCHLGFRRRPNMKTQLTKLALIAGLGIASALPSLAQPYYATGAFQGWAPGANVMSGGPTTYTYIITGGTPGAYHEWKVTGATWADPNWPGGGKNVKVKYDAGGSNTVYFTPGGIVDGWLPIANRIGYADPGNMSWELAGEFNGWGGGAGYDLPSIGNGVYSNSVVIATAGTYQFKFRSLGAWDVANGVDFGHDGANATVTTTNSPQTVPFVYDVPNGRFLIGNLVPPPVTNDVIFVVDMSVEILRGAFDPGVDRVCVSGGFNGWPGVGPTALVLTNVPTWAGGSNTNIYYATNIFSGSPSSLGSEYKFTSSNPNVPFNYEPIGPNRSFNLLTTNGTIVLPVVNFGNTLASDYTSADVTLTFSVNLCGRSSVSNVVFDPSVHPAPYINGNFLTNGWIGTWTPISLAPNQMTENPIGSTNYVFSYLMPKGHLVRVQYKYAFDDGVNGLDNEAPSGQDHVRFVRTTATGSYAMAQDTFGVQYGEPSFGELAVGTPSGGTVPVKWLGRPGVKLQSAASLTGSWTDHVQTDGTNWSIGTGTTNGLLSATNWPASSGNQFFRLIKQ